MKNKQIWLTHWLLIAHLGGSHTSCYKRSFSSHNFFHQNCPHSHFLHYIPIFLQYSDLDQRKSSIKKHYAKIHHI